MYFKWSYMLNVCLNSYNVTFTPSTLFMHSGGEQTKEDASVHISSNLWIFQIESWNCNDKLWRLTSHMKLRSISKHLLLWNLILSISTWSFYCRIHRRMFSHLRKGMAEQSCRERQKKRCKNVCWTFFLCPLALDDNLWQKSLLLKIPLFVCLSRAFLRRQAAEKKCKHFLRARHLSLRVAIIHVKTARQATKQILVAKPNFALFFIGAIICDR